MTTLVVLPARVVSGSGRGSDRGSGYWQSNPILRHCDKLFATWQVYEPSTSEFRVFVGTNTLGISGFSQISALPYPSTVPGWTAQAQYPFDEHGVASIIADKAGFLHLLYGAHRAPMLEAVSLNPWDANGFNSVIVDTPGWVKTTYSCVVRDSFGTLHLVYRGTSIAGADRLIYQRGTTDPTNGKTTWGPPQPLASIATKIAPDLPGYSNYQASIAVDAMDRLHVAYQMYYDPIGAARSWGYLRSNDQGNTWEDWQGNPVSPPVYNESTTLFVESSLSMDVRLCNIAIDHLGDPWISVTYLAPSYPLGGYDTKLWRLKNGQWSAISLTEQLPAVNGNARVAGATITFDAKGGLYVAADIVLVNDTTPHAWFAGNSKEVILLFSPEYGQPFQVYPISVPNPSRPRWLANIERPTTGAPIQVPSLLYTDCPPTDAKGDTTKPTDIVFVPLYKN